MLKTIAAVAVLAIAGGAIAPAAFADVSVNVGVGSDGTYKHKHHVALADPAPVRKHAHVYYSGDYAYVARDNGATIVHAYPGVDVFVGAGGSVSVNVAY